MNNDFTDLRTLDFVTLSEAKARLSEFVRSLSQAAKKLVLTTNGHPSAVLLSYQDYLRLVGQQSFQAPTKVIRFEDWKRERGKRIVVRDSILNLFDADKLSRKGQKCYKKKTVASFDQ